MKNKLLFIILLVLIPFFVSAQHDTIYKNLQLAEKYLNKNKFKSAARTFELLLIDNPNDVDLNFKLGFCMLNTKKNKYNALSRFESAIENYNDSCKNDIQLYKIYYYLGKAYHQNYKFDKAIEAFRKTKKLTNNSDTIRDINRKILKSVTALKLSSKPEKFVVSKLGVVNSEYNESNPVLTADDSLIIFTSKRPDGTGYLQTKNGEYYEDIYIYDKKNGIKSKPVNANVPLNNAKHDASAGLSSDGKTIFIYRSNDNNNGKIYTSIRANNRWTIPVKLGSQINFRKHAGYASVTANGEYMYFAGRRIFGNSGIDIFVSVKKKNGKWGKAKRLNKTINTEHNEESPYISPDGKTLYFSSKGHPGMGGYDVFYSVMQKNGKWTKPKNMGFPLNTVNDDIYYTQTKNGKKGYYTSLKNGVSNIYTVNIYDAKKTNLTIVSGYAKNNRTEKSLYNKTDCYISGDTIITPDKRILTTDRTYTQGDSVLTTTRKIENDKIIVIDSIGKVPKNVNIYVLDTNKKTLEESYSVNSVTGEYSFLLGEKKDYKIYYESEGYIFDTKNISLKNQSTNKIIRYNPEFKTNTTGKVKKSKKIEFKIGLTVLDNFTKLELDILLYFLEKNPDLCVSITGYDYIFDGSDNNYYLLEYEFAPRRKKNVINYLKENGLNSNRIFTDIFPVDVYDNYLVYTIFDKDILKKAKKIKKERTERFNKAVIASKKSKEDILLELKYAVLDSIKKDDDSKNKKISKNIYAICLIVSDNKIELSKFEDIKGISEKHYSNGKYMYFFGNFTDEQEVLDKLSKSKTKYPKAYIYIKKLKNIH